MNTKLRIYVAEKVIDKIQHNIFLIIAQINA